MVYILDKTDPLNCEITHTDWSKVKYSSLPKATYPPNGLYNRPEEIKVIANCDCEDGSTSSSSTSEEVTDDFKMKVMIPSYVHPSSSSQYWKDVRGV